MTSGRTGVPLATLRRIPNTRPVVAAGERCEMCAQPIADEHQHVVGLETRTLMCTCRGCYLLFTDQHAELRYRAVPDRYLSFPDFVFDAVAWDELQIPVESRLRVPQLGAGPGRRVLPEPGRRHRVRARPGGVGPGPRGQPGARPCCCPTWRRSSSIAPTTAEATSAACSCRSTSATSWSARCAPPGADSTAARRRAPRWRSSSREPSPGASGARGRDGERVMTDLRFEVLDVTAEPYAAAAAAHGPARHQRVDGERGACDRAALPGPDRAAATPLRRGQSRAACAPCSGAGSGGRDTLRPFLWMHSNTMVQGFSGSTEVDLPLPCTYDFDVIGSRYLHALGEGDVPLVLMFSGTVFTRGVAGFGVEQVPWDREAHHGMPVSVWRQMMELLLPEHRVAPARPRAHGRAGRLPGPARVDLVGGDGRAPARRTDEASRSCRR